MKKKYISLLLAAAMLTSFTSCNDWLDVKQNTEKPAEDIFSKYDGFKGVLTGVYTDLARSDLYGTRLTMTNIESLASLWYIDYTYTSNQENYYLRLHDYSRTLTQEAFKTIYSKLYNAVLEANFVIKAFADGKAKVIGDPKSRAVVEGEAYALRAFLQLDILRLFGEVPGGSKKVQLAYSEVTSKDDQLSYYSFDAYVEKLKADIAKAESLLKDNDPVSNYTLAELNEPDQDGVKVDDDFMTYRQYRMNYWAVKALEARMYMYIGQPQKAHDIALEVINATTTTNKKVTQLSSEADYGSGQGIRKYASPTECLFSLYYDNLHDISVPILAGAPTYAGADAPTIQFNNEGQYFCITPEMKNDLFLGTESGKDVRQRFMWADTKTVQQNTFPTLSKYYVASSGVIPLLRMSEMYLIAIEGASTLAESNELYYTYMVSKGVARHDYFKTTEEVKTELANEYRRELFGEGQMFYFYKRNKTPRLWSNTSQEMTEDEYIIPLPDTEKR